MTAGSGGGSVGVYCGEHDSFGNRYGAALGTAYTVVVPPAINSTNTANVTQALQDIVDAALPSTTIRCQPGGRYNAELGLDFTGKNYLYFDLNGGELLCNLRHPSQSLIQHCVISAPTYVSKGVATGAVAAASNGAVLPQSTIYYTGGGDSTGWVPTDGIVLIAGPSGPRVIRYATRVGLVLSGCTGGTGTLVTGQTVTQALVSQTVTTPTPGPGCPQYSPCSGPGIPTGTRTGTATKASGYHQAGISAPSNGECTPSSDVDVLFTPQTDQYRSNVVATNVSHVKIKNGKLTGANYPGGYNGVYEAAVEAQHNLTIVQARDCEFGKLTLSHPCGDFIAIAPTSSRALSQRVYIHDVTAFSNGRQGMSPTGVTDALISRFTMNDCRRTGIDTEVPDGSVVRRVTFRNWTISSVRFNWLSLSAYTGLPDVGDIVFENGGLNCPFSVAYRAAQITGPIFQRWGPFTFTDVRNLNGAVVGGVSGASIAFDHVDGALVTGCKFQLQANRNPAMYGVRATKSTGISSKTVHDNDWFDGAGELFVVPYGGGKGGGTVGVTGSGSGSSSQPAQAVGGGDVGVTGSGAGRISVRGDGAGFVGISGHGKGTWTFVSNTSGEGTLGITGSGSGGPPIDDVDNGAWRTGRVALRGPGWNENGWDNDPWGGLG